MSAYGIHVLGDLYDCDGAALDDLPTVEAAMREAARRAGATIVTDVVHRFSPQGVSGVVVIAESHLTIHTWPEERYAAIDLFTCGNTVRPELGVAHLVEALGCRHHTVTTARRGSRHTARAPDREQRRRIITVIDGGPAGDGAAIGAHLRPHLEDQARMQLVALADGPPPPDALAALLRASDGFVLAASAPASGDDRLAAFLARATAFADGWTWLGKPAAVLIASDGGDDAHARLQGALSAMGCLLPPMSAIAYARGSEPPRAELEVIVHNLLEAIGGGGGWRTF